MDCLLPRRSGIRQINAIHPNSICNCIPVFVPDGNPSEAMRSVLHQHLHDFSIPPGDWLALQEAEIDSSAVVSFQPLWFQGVNFTFVPISIHVVILSECLQGLLLVLYVLQHLIPPVFAEHAFPEDKLKMQNDDFFQVNHCRAWWLRNSWTMDGQPAAEIGAVIDETQCRIPRRDPGFFKTRQNVYPTKT